MNVLQRATANHLTSPVSLTNVEAFLTIVMCPGLSDGYLSSVEQETLVYQLAQIDSISRLGPASALDSISRLAQRYGYDQLLLSAANTLSVEFKESAFLFAAEVAIADGDISDDERESLGMLGSLLELDSETYVALANAAISRSLVRFL